MLLHPREIEDLVLVGHWTLLRATAHLARRVRPGGRGPTVSLPPPRPGPARAAARATVLTSAVVALVEGALWAALFGSALWAATAAPVLSPCIPCSG